MAIVVLGNTAPTIFEKTDEAGTDGQQVAVIIDNGADHNQTETTFSLPPGTPVQEAIVTVTSVWWRNHSTEKPAWVESDDENLATVIAATFSCPVGRPADWQGYGVEPPVPTIEEPVK